MIEFSYFADAFQQNVIALYSQRLNDQYVEQVEIHNQQEIAFLDAQWERS